MSFSHLPFLFHSSTLAIMVSGYMGCPDLDIPVAQMKGGQLQFLTIQGLCLACITMVLSMVYDLVPSTTVKNLKRACLMGALPIAIVISVIYWTLLLAMPHMILMASPVLAEPSSSSIVPEMKRLPLHYDLALHAVPAISLFFDFYFLENKYSKNVTRYGSFAMAAAMGTWYSWWVEYCASHNGIFPYPFLTHNPFNIRVTIYAGASVFAAFAFILLNTLHS